MEKKLYIQPIAILLDFKQPIMEGPLVSQQYDEEEHTPIGEDDGSDDFTTKERDDRNPWAGGLW